MERLDLKEIAQFISDFIKMNEMDPEYIGYIKKLVDLGPRLSLVSCKNCSYSSNFSGLDNTNFYCMKSHAPWYGKGVKADYYCNFYKEKTNED